jgi:hypothetical protein
VSRCSFIGNEQHNPGQPLHWAKGKSTDHEDCILRHLTDHVLGVPMDTDNIPHRVKVAWRALAALETAIENGEVQIPRIPMKRPERQVGLPGRPHHGAQLRRLHRLA